MCICTHSHTQTSQIELVRARNEEHDVCVCECVHICMHVCMYIQIELVIARNEELDSSKQSAEMALDLEMEASAKLQVHLLWSMHTNFCVCMSI